jgi:hypothetical protein
MYTEISYAKLRKDSTQRINANTVNPYGVGVKKRSKDFSRQLTLSLQGVGQFAPDYDSEPYWSLHPVPINESLPGQRYRLVLTHGRLSRAIPVQLHPMEGTRLFDAIQSVQCDWALCLDGSGQLIDDEARSALAVLVEALVGGES